MKKTIDIIAVTYGQNSILKCFINSIKSQTSDEWRLVIIHDGPNETLQKELENENYLIDGKIEFIQFHTRTQKYGHELRKWALENVVKNEYVLLTNGDNYYTPNMVDSVLKSCVDENIDFIFFDAVHSHPTKFNSNKSDYGYFKSELKRSQLDMGSVVVKSKLAKTVGFNSTAFAADWHYFESILEKNPMVHKIDKVLFVHN